MADERITTPSGSTGLMRFYDVTSSVIQLEPTWVVGFTIALIIVELALQAFK